MKYSFLPPYDLQIDRASLKLGELVDAKFLRTKSLEFSEKGERKRWEMISGHDSVCVLIYDRDLDCFVIVRQFRPPVFLRSESERDAGGEVLDLDSKNANFQRGLTYELCAGIVDKPKSIEQIAAEEVFEECGYSVEPSRLEPIATFYGATSISGSITHAFYVCVNSKDKKGSGGGIEDECIQVINLPQREALEFLSDACVPKTLSLLFAINWFYLNKRIWN